MEVFMKKLYLCFALLAVTALCAIAVDEEVYSKLFLSRFIKCIPCSMNLAVMADGQTVNISRKIAGWHDHKCKYMESTVSNGKSSSATCYLSREQVNELVSAMRNDPMGTSTAKTAWERYKKNAEICTSN